MIQTNNTPLTKQRLQRRCARAVQTMRIKLMLKRIDKEAAGKCQSQTTK